MRAYRYPSDHDELDPSLVQGLEQLTKVEFAQRALAAPLMALICLESA